MSAVIKAIVTDIEGTTTPLTFVKDVLFPYILDNLESYLKNEYNNPEFRVFLEDIRKQSIEDTQNGVEGIQLIPDLGLDEKLAKESIIKNIKTDMSNNRKIASLKNLQGYIWRSGYERGILKAYCYPDVEEALKRWTEKNIPIYIYSSGSIEAQKLLFKYTESGDLLKYFKGHFDTVTAGSKLVKESYDKIAEAINLRDFPQGILFLSDNIKELDAAKQAGFSIITLVRPQNEPIDESTLKNYPNTTTFDSII